MKSILRHFIVYPYLHVVRQESPEVDFLHLKAIEMIKAKATSVLWGEEDK